MTISNQTRLLLLASSLLLLGGGLLWALRSGEEPPFELLAPPRVDLRGRAVEAVDGDTLEVSLEGRLERVRLLLVDAPETRGPRGRPEELSLEAKAFLARAAVGKEVLLELDAVSRDRYGRVLAHLYVQAEGGFVNLGLELVRRGLAQLMVIRPNARHLEAFLEAQREAKSEERGLWRLCRRRIFLSRDLASSSPYLVGRFVGVVLRAFKARGSGDGLLLEDEESPLLVRIHLEAFGDALRGLISPGPQGKLLAMGKLGVDRSGRPRIEVSSPLQLETDIPSSALRKRFTSSSLATATR